MSKQTEKLEGKIETLKKTIEELKHSHSDEPRKCYSMDISREEQLIQGIRNLPEFKECIHKLMETDGVRNVSIKFTYTPNKPKEEWTKDGLDYTRTIIDNNISNPEIRDKMSKIYLKKTKDGNSVSRVYPEEYK